MLKNVNLLIIVKGWCRTQGADEEKQRKTIKKQVKKFLISPRSHGDSIALVSLPIEGEGWGEGLLRVLFGALATFVRS